jgi:acetylornithine deacetylase/succinyl-diaminopimelate desuccinylase-like protein
VESILADLIRIDTSNPPGNEKAAADYLANLFGRYGIPHRVVESAPGRASFVARLGRGTRRLLFLSHTDVVPAGSGWDFPPFGGEIRDGYVLGRGALDDKSLVAAEAYVFLRLAEEGRPLNGTLIFVAAADEEAGGRYGLQYLAENLPEVLEADFAVNEGAPEPVMVNGRPIYFLQVGEKGIAQSRLRTGGKAAHGSTPTLGENAVAKMAEIIGRLAGSAPPVELLPEVRVLFEELARHLGVPAPTERDPDPFLERFEDRGFREYLRALTRMTVSPNVVHGGTRVNVVPDACELLVDVRLLPGQTRADAEALLRRLAGPEAEIEVFSYHPPTRSPAQVPACELIQQVLLETTGAAACLPCLSTGATDSRFLREMGIPAYGICPWRPDFEPALKETVHGPNERIDLASLNLAAEFLYRLAVTYLG